MLEFRGEKALEYAKAITQPRLTGSKGEIPVRSFLVNTLKSFNLSVQQEEFEFYPALELNLKFLLTIFLILATASFLSLARYPILSGAGAIFLLVVIVLSPLVGQKVLTTSWVRGNLIWATTLKRMRRMGKKKTSINIIAHLRKAQHPSENIKRVFVLAHYDSKSQSLPLILRITMLGLLLVGSVFFSAGVVLFHLQHEIGEYLLKIRFLPVFFGLTLFSGTLLLFLTTGNRSPGAIDNAAGAGILLHLAEVISQNKEKLPGLDVIFIATGAEELGLIGAFAYCRKHRAELIQQRQNSCFLNLDGPGIDGKMAVVSRKRLWKKTPIDTQNLVQLIQETGRQMGVSVKQSPFVIGALADHYPFAVMGLSVVTLSNYSTKSLAVHTSRDTIEKLNLGAMQKTGTLICRLIEKLAR